jgi:putative Ca2+/H+ antiporter (TMEM165/GDT1 family)
VPWLAAVTAFVLVVPVELPDKTFISTLVLTTRYRPLPVWLGVVAAFGVQSGVAVGAGSLVGLLPETPVRLAAAALFAVGAIVLAVQARKPVEYEEPSAAGGHGPREGRAPAKPAQATGGWKAFGASFLVLFLAEWGDLSQLLTAGLVADGRPPVPVFFGAWAGLAVVSGVAVVLGRVILRYVRLNVVRWIGAYVCAVLAIVTATGVT